MSVRIALPTSLDDESIESVIGQTAERSPEEPITLDMRSVRFASPFALNILLAIARTRAERPILLVPANGFENYLAQSGFLAEASDLFIIDGAIPPPHSTPAKALLPIAHVSLAADDHALERVIATLASLLSGRPQSAPPSMAHVASVVTSACALMAQQTRGGFWIAAQWYRFKTKTIGDALLVAAACDGMTLRQASTGSGQEIPRDEAAIENALDAGGALHGLDSLCRRSANQLLVRSGTARVSRRSPLYDRRTVQTGLAPMSGVQLQILIASPGSLIAHNSK